MQQDALADARSRIRRVGFPTRLPDCAYAHSRPTGLVGGSDAQDMGSSDAERVAVAPPGRSGKAVGSEKEILSDVAARLDAAAAA